MIFPPMIFGRGEGGEGFWVGFGGFDLMSDCVGWGPNISKKENFMRVTDCVWLSHYRALGIINIEMPRLYAEP